MIGTLEINRFKSINSLRFPALRKINVFIGPPDTGKTNILDALRLLSCFGWGVPLGPALRLSKEVGFEALFFHQFFTPPMTISFDGAHVTGELKGQDRHMEFRFSGDGRTYHASFESKTQVADFRRFRSYNYTDSQDWSYQSPADSLAELVAPPNGSNLIFVAKHNQRVYQCLMDLVAGMHMKVHFVPSHNTLRISEVREGEIVDYNLDLLSDSVKRLFFYSAILITARKSVLVLDEPDVHAFPPFPKRLGEQIAADSSNQFFITTHNPYLLSSIIEKTPRINLSVYVCSRGGDGSTQARPVSDSQLQEMLELGSDVFFNLKNFVSA